MTNESGPYTKWQVSELRDAFMRKSCCLRTEEDDVLKRQFGGEVSLT